MSEHQNCLCKRTTCKRYGNCELCKAHHSGKASPPTCERIAANKEKKERSLK